jgi:hypothetical protein
MTHPAKPVVRLRNGGELIAAVPYLLGFDPGDALVVIALGARSPNVASLGLVQRCALPAAGPETELAAATLVGNLAESGADAAHVVIIGAGAPEGGTPPRPDLITALDRVCADARIVLTHALWVASITVDEPWLCYTHPSCHGLVPDPRTSPLAAMAAAAGLVTYANRDELAAQLDPPDPAALLRRTRLLADPPTGPVDLDALRTRVVAAILAAHSGRRPTTDAEYVELALALDHLPVRDSVLAESDGEYAQATEALWLELVRGVPAPHRAAPATLLAVAAWYRGDGALARAALGNALVAHPGYTLAELLDVALTHGMSPDTLRELTADLADDAAGEVGQPSTAAS